MERHAVETRMLQAVVLAGALVPVAAGLAGIVEGAGLTGERVSTALDSHLRYLSGLLLAIGLAFWSTVPAIAARGARFRLLTAVVVAGGLGRLAGIVLHGPPPAPMLFGLAMELAVTPALCLWQARVARLSGARA